MNIMKYLPNVMLSYYQCKVIRFSLFLYPVCSITKRISKDLTKVNFEINGKVGDYSALLFPK